MQFKYYKRTGYIKINNLIPNYVSDLEDSLKFRVMELFTDKEINEFDIVEIEDDIDLKNFTKEKIYEQFKQETIYICNECSFLDKYGNIGIKYIGNYKSLKQHLRFHNNLLKR